MDINKAIEILDNHNKWRRDSEGVYKMAEPKELGIAIDTVVSEFRSNLSLDCVSNSICCGKEVKDNYCKKCGNLVF